MYTNQFKFKYLEWHSAEEIHATTSMWKSQLIFIEGEQSFLSEILENYAMDLLHVKDLVTTKNLITELAKYEEQVPELKSLISKHWNALELLIDDIDEPEKERAFKDRHLLLSMKIEDYISSYNKLKTEIFALVRQVLKKKKQKKLLS